MSPLWCVRLLALSILVTAAGIVLARRFAGRVGLVDRPSDRKRHGSPVPIAGGLGVFATLAAGYAVTALVAPQALHPYEKSSGFLAGAGAALFLLGLLDDRFDLPSRLKLILQAVPCVVAMAGGIVLTELPSPAGTLHLGWAGYPLTLFWLLGMINAVNLIDGLDGLAAGIIGLTAAALTSLAVHGDLLPLAIPSILILGSVLGFLPFNLSRWRVFLGDGGTMLLGFLLAGITVLAARGSHRSDPLVVCLAFMTVPVLDVATTIFRRIKSRAAVFRADAWHIHHRLMWLGLGPRRALLVLLGLTVSFGCQGLAFTTELGTFTLLVGYALGLGIFLLVYRSWRAQAGWGKTGVLDFFLFLLAARRPAAGVERYRAPAPPVAPSRSAAPLLPTSPESHYPTRPAQQHGPVTR